MSVRQFLSQHPRLVAWFILAVFMVLMLLWAAIIAALLHRDFCRGRDDVTVLALNLEAPRG